MFSPYGIQISNELNSTDSLHLHDVIAESTDGHWCAGTTSMVTCPNIAEWLHYCDKHPQRSGDNLSAHILNFEDQGYQQINQIMQATIEQLLD